MSFIYAQINDRKYHIIVLKSTSSPRFYFQQFEFAKNTRPLRFFFHCLWILNMKKIG